MRINGNLTLNTGGNSEVQNLVIERLTVANFPSIVTSEKGRILFGTDTNSYYYNNGTVWMTFATGGNATALQTEVDNLETSLGAIINADGTFASSAFAGAPFIASATSVTDAITILAGQINTDTYLYNLLDVSIGSRIAGQFLHYNASGKWENHTLVLADVSDVTTTASELNQLNTSGATLADFVKLHALTATAANINILTATTVTSTTLNYIDSLTSNAQTQLNNKQPLTSTLTSISTLGAPGANDVLVGSATSLGTWTFQTGAGFRSTQGLVIGTDIQAWSTNLDQLAGFTTAADTSETTTINGISTTHTGLNVILVGSGTATAGDYWTEVSGAAARTKLGLGNIAVLDESRFVRADAASSSNIAVNLNMNNYKLVNLAPGTLGQDAVNLNQLEAAITGLTWKNAVMAGTTANLTALSGLPTIDTNYVVQAGDRILVRAQTTASQNGIYVAASGTWVRATDMDAAAEFDGAAVLVEHGATLANTAWTCNSVVATVGTDAVNFVQFNGAAGVTAGTGLQKVGNTLSVQLGAGIAELPTSEVGVDIYTASGAIILTTDGSTRSTDAAAQLHLLLDLTTVYGNLVQSASGLKVTTNTIGKAEIMAEIAGSGLTGGNGSALSVVTAAGTAATGGDTPANWTGIGTLDITANAVGVMLGDTSTTAAPGNHTHKASAITFDNSVANFPGSPANVQAALVAADGRLDSIETNAGALLAEVNAIEASVGPAIKTDGTFDVGAFSATNYLSAASSVTNAIVTLDTKTAAIDSKFVNAITKMYYVGTMASSTTWTVTHNLGQQYVNVTIVDASNNVIIPQSIVMTDANTTTVTFNVAVAGKAIIMGLASGLAVTA